MPSSSDINDRISSVQNVKQITRAMEMVAAARLRRAEQRIEALRPYADAIRRMTRRAVDAAERLPDLPLLEEHDSIDRVGILLVTSDRGLAGAFNSQIIRAGERRAGELEREGQEAVWYVVGSRGASSMTFRGRDPQETYTGFTDRPAYSHARDVAQDMISAYADEEIDGAEVFYNGYISPMSQVVRHERLMPIHHAEFLGSEEDDDEEEEENGEERSEEGPDHSRSLWIYEPEPGEILRQLAPDYIEISIFRAMLESTASEHGARMTAMRNASQNADEMLDDLKMQANRERQAQITQEIMEVVAGAEATTG